MNENYIINNITKSKKFFSTLSRSQMTEKICRLAVSTHPANITYVPKDKQTKALWELAISIEPNTIGSLPKEQRTDDLAWTAIKRQWSTIMLIPNPSAAMVEYVAEYLHSGGVSGMQRWFRRIKQTPETRQIVLKYSAFYIHDCWEPTIDDWILAGSQNKSLLRWAPKEYRAQLELMLM